MLTLLQGTGAARIFERAKLLSPYVHTETLQFKEVAPSELCERAETLTLFGDTRAYLVDLSEADDLAIYNPILETLSVSAHFFLLETESGAQFAKEVARAGGAVVKVKAPPVQKAFDPFVLASALERGDKKALWIAYEEALRAGHEPEALAGILAWKARSMLGRSSLKDERARKLSSDMVTLYHESRRGAGDLGLLLERYILTL